MKHLVSPLPFVRNDAVGLPSLRDSYMSLLYVLSLFHQFNAFRTPLLLSCLVNAGVPTGCRTISGQT